MTADDIIGLLAVINTLVMGMVGWLLRQGWATVPPRLLP